MVQSKRQQTRDTEGFVGDREIHPQHTGEEGTVHHRRETRESVVAFCGLIQPAGSWPWIAYWAQMPGSRGPRPRLGWSEAERRRSPQPTQLPFPPCFCFLATPENSATDPHVDHPHPSAGLETKQRKHCSDRIAGTSERTGEKTQEEKGVSVKVPKISSGLGTPNWQGGSLDSNTSICSALCSLQSTFLHIPAYKPHRRLPSSPGKMRRLKSTDFFWRTRP